GDFILGNYEILEKTINDDIAIVKLKYSGSITEPESGQKLEFDLIKIIKLQSGSNKFNVSFNLQPSIENNNPEILNEILNDLRIGIEVPFFFNGDPKQFKYTFNEDKLKILKNDSNTDFTKVKPFQKCNFFSAYDQTYDLTFSIKVLRNAQNANMGKYSIKTFSRTITGYQKIFQGLNLIVTNSLVDFELEFSVI
ncbi:unnamed protein product, partial [marine sediment metagenome]